MTDERKPCIYKVENKENGKVYIGKASYPNSRFRNHKSKLNRGIHENPHLQNAWDKYGEENFSFVILLFCGHSNMSFYEERAINSYDSLNNDKGYNITEETGKNRVMPEESINRMKGPRPSVSGEDNPMYGVERSEEVKIAISEAQTGRKHSEEEVKKRVENMPDYSGENNPMYGVKGEDHPRYGEEHTEEAKRKLSEAQKGKKGLVGGDNPQSELNEDMVREIKWELKHTEKSHSEIAENYPVKRGAITNINTGDSWNHISIKGEEDEN